MMMSKKVEVEIRDGEGLLALLGENVFLMCMNYYYTGKLVGVNKTCVLLEDAQIVYETGEWNKTTWADAQALPDKWYVQIAAIESFGISGR